MRASPWATLLLAACTGLDAYGPDPRAAAEPPSDATDDTDAAAPPTTDDSDLPIAATPTLDDVQPAWGSTAGGDTITLLGADLADATRVEIGGRRATIVSAADGELVVTTPDAASDGRVDVRVTTPGGEARLAGGYRYWLDGTGRVTGRLTLERIRWLGDYWQSPPAASAWATASFFEPVDTRFFRLFGPTADGCVNGWTSPDTLARYDLAADELRLVAGQNEVVLEPDADDPLEYVSRYLPVAQVPLARLFDLAPVAGDFPAFPLDDVVAGVDTFDVTSPNLDRANMPTVARNNLTLRWSGSGGDYVVATLLHIAQPARGNPYVEQVVSCVSPDDGALTVPFGAWDGWAQNADDYLEIHVARVREVLRELPHDHGSLDVASTAWVVGAAWMQ